MHYRAAEWSSGGPYHGVSAYEYYKVIPKPNVVWLLLLKKYSRVVLKKKKSNTSCKLIRVLLSIVK